MSLRQLTCVIGLVLIGGVAAADSVTLTPSRDNTLYELSNGVEVSNAVGPHLYAGQTLFGERRRGLVRFDVSSIPAGSTITSVELTVNINRGNGEGLTFGLHRVVADWGQGTSNAGDPGGRGTAATPGDPTWRSNFFGTSQWSANGGDVQPAPSGTTIMNAAGFPVTWFSSQGLVADVQGWVANPAANFGWAIIGGESTFGSAVRMNSMESLAGPPTLVVTFTPPASTCGNSDFNGDGDFGTDQDIEAFFACLGGSCCTTCWPQGADFNGDGDFGTDQDIEAFFRVLGGGVC